MTGSARNTSSVIKLRLNASAVQPGAESHLIKRTLSHSVPMIYSHKSRMYIHRVSNKYVTAVDVLSRWVTVRIKASASSNYANTPNPYKHAGIKR